MAELHLQAHATQAELQSGQGLDGVKVGVDEPGHVAADAAAMRRRAHPAHRTGSGVETHRDRRVGNPGRRLRSTDRFHYHSAVAYDEELAERIRELIGNERGLTEKKMFGGLAFLINGNMSVAASGQGGLLVRVDPDRSDRLVASSHAHPMEMRGRQMQGWLRVDAEHVRTKRQLASWVQRGVAFARSLPPKR